MGAGMHVWVCGYVHVCACICVIIKIFKKYGYKGVTTPMFS